MERAKARRDEQLRSQYRCGAPWLRSILSCPKSFGVLCSLAVDAPNQDISIREDVHLPLVFAGIDVLTAERFIRDGRRILGNDIGHFLEGPFEFFGADLLSRRYVTGSGNDVENRPAQ